MRAKILPAQTALIIIDMQKDYCCKGGIFDRRGFDVTPCRQLAVRLSRFLNDARKALKHIVHVKMTKIPGLLSPPREEHYRRLGIDRKVRSDLRGILQGSPAGRGDSHRQVQLFGVCLNLPRSVFAVQWHQDYAHRRRCHKCLRRVNRTRRLHAGLLHCGPFRPDGGDESGGQEVVPGQH